jgi:hypothetical protein
MKVENRHLNRQKRALGPEEFLPEPRTKKSDLGDDEIAEVRSSEPRRLPGTQHRHTPPATTFHARDSDSNTELYERLWEIHSGFCRLKGSPIDEVQKGYRQDPNLVNRRLTIECTLSEFPDWVQRRVCRMADDTDIRAFNSHYAGLVGFAIGAALSVLYDGVEDVLGDESPLEWDTEIARPLCEAVEIDYQGLIQLVFDKLEDNP